MQESQALTNNPGTLFVVATPIGNLDDISARALDVLSKADVVAAEDTRRAGQLLTRLGFRRRLLSMHEHNEAERVEQLMEVLISGGTVALISDAGTPLVNDPGYRLLVAARDRDLPVSPIPGCCAAIAALSVAGLPTDRFRFEGFLPAKAAARRKRLAVLSSCPDTLIFYESVHRIIDLLDDLLEVFGPERPMTLARELTKLHETIYRGSVQAVREQLKTDPGGSKGEFTLVVAGLRAPLGPGDDELQRIVEILLAELPARQAASLAAEITGAGRREAYRVANALKDARSGG
jgi:16S rRNA (cytidine1402-2'-O)-methyltransferase